MRIWKKNCNFAAFFKIKTQKRINMDYLPKDPAILVSSINMLLRDEEFDSLESLCCNFNTEPEKLKTTLREAGYIFSEEQKQFRPVLFA